MWSRMAHWGLSPTELVDKRAFLQRRVALYAKVLFVLLFTLYIIDVAVILTTQMWGTTELSLLWGTLVYVGLFAPFGVVWRVARRGERPGWVLALMEVGCTLLACGSCVAAIASGRYWIAAERGGSLMIAALLLAIVMVLVMRAALVPSSTARTLGLGLLIAAAAAAAGYVAFGDTEAAAPQLSTRWEAAMMLGLWVAVFAVITAVNSRVLYGLHAHVRGAMRIGQYTLEEKIGEGGMGAVYRGRHALLRRSIAVKLLPPDKAGERAIRHFEQEVQQTSQLTHPNTVRIHDFGRTPDGIFYYVMEYLDGLTLRELVELDGVQPPGRVIRILAQAAHALAEAHGAGLIHRDIKPANILLVNRGGVADFVKLVDFGLVRRLEADGHVEQSRSDRIEGTPLYIAPEVVTAPQDVDGRADIYALAAVGYFLLTGSEVFEGNSPVEVLAKHLEVKPEPPSVRLGGPVPGDLEQLILQCLEKKPEDRPRSARALWEALRSCDDARGWRLEQAQQWWEDNAAALDGLRRRRQASVAQHTPDRGALTVALAGRH
jgi:hypothetical protein